MSASLDVKITTPIPVLLDKRLEQIAKATGLKKSLLIRAALERQLPEIERNGITFPATNKLADTPEAAAAAGRDDFMGSLVKPAPELAALIDDATG